MGGKHKKKLREEKSKVKLKKSEKTKFLPKGKNVTDVSFKIKPIVLPEQLRQKQQDVPLSKKHLDVKDLVQRMRHYNENVRHSACEETADMIKYFHEDIVNNHLAVVIKTVTTLIQDKIAKVRQSAVKVVDKLLEHCTHGKVEPFFDFLSVNLRCAMTNINKTIQEDSLMLLDALLKHVPNLIAKNPEKILSDFFTLISKLRNDSQIGRTLTVNLGSQLTSVKWRLKVLSRLYRILKAIIEDKGIKSYNNSTIYEENDNIVLYKDAFSEKLNLCDVSFFENNITEESETSKSFILNKHIVTLIPLLYETWVEVIPSNGFKTENTILNEESSAMLACVMKILYLLWEYTRLNHDNNNINMNSVFLSNEGKKFLTHLVGNFPYSQGEKMKMKEKNKTKSILNLLDGNEDPKCVEQNLLICYIYSVLHIKKNHKDPKILQIMSYVTRCLLSNNSFINSHNIKFLILILKSILVENTKNWQKQNVEVETILENTITFYNNSRLGENSKMEVFSILIDVSDNELLKSLPKYDAWVCDTVNSFLEKEISARKINLLFTLIKRDNSVFKESFSKKITLILENIPFIKITDNPDENLVKKEIIKIIYYLPLNRENLKDISNFLDKFNDGEISNYLRLTLNLKGIVL
ncbi:unnamed protein product [Brassicogethes aeneus]|uniref:Pre-rRNA-processing protein Ipi1 N-terminal domain-containing protein n=1 Tax=Brassicogethes aeneus TaxID=1431903 RepID=A0A9P0AUY1_BRAAE|nr:unnamed protein product [Brassicogethes aeneus]